MAARTRTKATSRNSAFLEDRQKESVTVVDATEEFEKAFITYGNYSNERAIPRVVDGMKLGGRRILWSMLSASKAVGTDVKGATVVGDVMGKFHPHGDSAIYQTVVGMALSEGKPFRRRVPFIHGQGNWGSLDAEAAAMRYTECRLNQFGLWMLGRVPGETSGTEINEGAVQMRPTYDGKNTEPVYLPALFPNFVINGDETAIGTGVSSSSFSHNPVEAMKLALLLIQKPEYLENVTPKRMEIIRRTLPGPDFACDAIIYDEGGVEDYLMSGRGTITMRAKYHVDEDHPNGKTIVFDGLPYRVSPEQVINGCTRLQNNGWLSPDIEFTDVSVESPCVEVTLNGADADEVLNVLFHFSKDSSLQGSYSCFSWCIMPDGTIRRVGTLEALSLWIDHRRVCIRNRSKYRLNKAKSRLEIVDGFLLAVPIIKEIVDTVRQSNSRAEAAQAILDQWTFFTENQVQALLDLSIAQLVKLNMDKYSQEKTDLETKIDFCQKILSDRVFLDKVLSDEIRAIIDAFPTEIAERRCELVIGAPPATTAPEAEAPPAVQGFLVKSTGDRLRWAFRSTVSQIDGNHHVEEILPVDNQMIYDTISNLGVQRRTPVNDLPEDKMKSIFTNWYGISPGERPLYSGVIYNHRTDGVYDKNMVMVTNFNRIKMISPAVWDFQMRRNKYHQQVIALAEGEEVTFAFPVDPTTADIILLTGYGRALRLDAEALSVKGRSSSGIPAMRITDDGDSIIWAGSMGANTTIAYWDGEYRLGAFGGSVAADIKYGGRNTQGQFITKTSNWLIGARSTESHDDSTPMLNWYSPEMDDKMSVELTDLQKSMYREKALIPLDDTFRTATSIWAS